jgi:DNA primase
VYEADADALWEKVKKKTTVIDFIGAFVPLRKTGYGAIGKCPFHADTHASFGINAKENYWHCFAGCGAGSIIDFWMKWRKIEFAQAVDELADVLGVERNGLG